MNFNKSQVIDIYNDNSSSDPEFDGKHGINRKVKAVKLMSSGENFIKTVSNSVISGLSLNKSARLDLSNMISHNKNC